MSGPRIKLSFRDTLLHLAAQSNTTLTLLCLMGLITG